ncbi:hypothetical protein ACQKLX_15630 [Bosea sp. NPDC003192]|uniref:hypothetical protein n=1 Tax=Bosea sp. NPDC003192 TaxID=3390551 RepID=UPI003D07B352
MRFSAVQNFLRRAAAFASQHRKALILGICLLNLTLGIFVPIYVDELVYKFGLARYLLEGGQQLSIYPQCIDTFLTPVPLPLIPGAVIIAGAWQHLGLFGMRFSGFAFIVAWAALIWLIISRLTASRDVRVAVAFTLFAVMSLGVTSYALLLSRPDQFLVLGLTILVAFPIILDARERETGRAASGWIIATAALVYFLVISTASYAHPNIVYYTPVVLASAYLTFRRVGLLPALGACAIALVVIGFGLMNGARVLASCNDPALAAATGKRLVDLRGLLTAPLATIGVLLGNSLGGLFDLLRYVSFTGNYQSGWLPPTPLLDGVIGGTFLFVIRVIWHVAVVGAIVVATARLLHDRSPALLLAGALLISLAGQAAHNRSLNFTLIQLLLPLVALFCVLALTPVAETALSARWWMPLRNVVAGFAAASALVCLIFLVPQLIGTAWSKRIFNDQQHHSYSAFNASIRAQSTARLAQACRIVPGQAPGLVIDDVSYATFYRERRPMFATYVNPSLMGAGLKGRLPEFFASHRSSGFIGKCNYLPWELQSVAIRDGENCCVSAEVITTALPASAK